MAQFEVGGRKYQARKLNALQQFHLGRKIGPAVVPFYHSVQPLIGAYLASRSGGGMPEIGQMLSGIEPFLKVLSTLPEEDCDYVIKVCLGAVTRADAQGGGWSPVWNDAADRLMFDDIDLPAMLAITGHVIKDNLGGFTSALQQNSSGAAGRA